MKEQIQEIVKAQDLSTFVENESEYHLALRIDSKPAQIKFFLDTGATEHMTKEKWAVNDIRLLVHPKIISVANKDENAKLIVKFQGTLEGVATSHLELAGTLLGSSMRSKHWRNLANTPIKQRQKVDELKDIIKSDCKMPLNNNNYVNKVNKNKTTLNEILYSEGIGFNLMSAGKIVEAGYRIVLDSEQGEILQKNTNKCLLNLKYENQTWTVKVTPMLNKALATTN